MPPITQPRVYRVALEILPGNGSGRMTANQYFRMAQVNQNLLYQPDEQPSHPASLVHGFQNVMTRMAAMAATASIIAVAGGQSQSYLSWIFFSALVVCGIGTILQTFRFWRFGSGYSLGVSSGSAFIAICISALLAGGPALLSSLIVVSALIQFVFISRLSWLRRVISPLVAGTVLMLLASTIITVVLSRLSDLPEGAPSMAAPILAGTTLVILMMLRLFATPKWQQCAPIVAIVVGCAIAAPFGAYDWQHVMDASWIGFPSYAWPGFDLTFGATFWGLLPGFVIVNMATMINSVSDTVVIQQVAWRKPRATDFRVVQGAHYLQVLTNLLAAALGTLPNMIGATSSARVMLTGVAARRMGIYGGLILIAVAFSPKLIALVVATPRPVLAAYMTFMLSLLFVQGMTTIFKDRVDGRKAAVVGVSLWIGIGFQNQVILPELLTGTLGTLLSSGMTTGAVCVILLTLLMEFTSKRRRRLSVAMNLSSLPRIDSFLQGFAASVGWNEASTNRLRSAGEETLSCLLPQDEEPEEHAGKRLIVAARRADAAIEMEFVVTTEGENLEDKLAYMSEQPEIQDERELSFRLLRHYASSVHHNKYNDIDIITVQVAPS